MKKNYILITILLTTLSINLSYAQCTKSNWNHQKPFLIDNSTITENLVDFPVKLTFDSETLITAGEMQADGADIRVSLNCDGTEPLDFWFDDINTDSTNLWVKMSSLTMGVNITVYVHYGNVSAVLESNSQTVFTYHSDFNSGDLSNWSFDPDGGTWALDTIDGESVMSCTNPPTGNGTSAMLNTNLTDDNYIIEMEIYAQADGNMGGVVFEFDDFDNYSSYHLMTGSDMTMSSIITNNSPNYNLTEPFPSEPQVWYDWSVIRNFTGDSSSIYLNNQLQRTIPSYFSGSGAGLWAYGGGVIYFDNLFIRKYTEVQPVATELTDTSLSISTIGSFNDEIIIYPNPASDFIKVSDIIEKQNYKIYDFSGTEILKGTILDDGEIIINKISNGLYFLKFDNGNTVKFIKK